MGKHKSKRNLVGPWRNLHAAVWLLGLAILAWQRWWWPGILVLVALSLILETVLQQYAPQAFEKAEPSTASFAPPPLVPAHRLELLPSVCANCGGPIRGQEVKWTGTQSADCPYCGVNLPMRGSEPESREG